MGIRCEETQFRSFVGEYPVADFLMNLILTHKKPEI
jgi:hypothetical protein